MLYVAGGDMNNQAVFSKNVLMPIDQKFIHKKEGPPVRAHRNPDKSMPSRSPPRCLQSFGE